MTDAARPSEKMRIGILGSNDSWHVKDLLRACQREGCHAEVISFDALSAALGAPGHTASVQHYDVIVVRSMPKGTLEQIIFRMDVLGEFERRGGLVVNRPGALEMAIDKYLALSRLQEAGLTVPDTIVCQTTDTAMDAFVAMDGDVVLKPLFGSEGRGLVRVSDLRTAKEQIEQFIAGQGVAYVQRFVNHTGFDYRLFVIGDRVLGMRRENMNDWKLNVKQGATAEPMEPDDRLTDLALRAASAVRATVAGIDLLPDRSGNLYALEVNAVPGWKALGQATAEDVAGLVLDHVIRLVGQRDGHLQETVEVPRQPAESM